MYVHTHWSYNHPYSARTWAVGDWRGYLTGLSRLGYDTVMIWPQCDSMPPEPTESDRAWLKRLGEVVDIAHHELGMKVLMVLCPNTIGNDAAAQYAFSERPYFATEKKVDPADAAQRQMFIAGRRRQLGPIAKADALVIIDSDPGGYPGATAEQFVDLLVDQVAVFRSLNATGEFVYWMWSGWEATCRFWKGAHDDPAADHPAQTAEQFAATLEMIRSRIPEPWWVLAGFPTHNEALDATGLRDKAMWNPYGLIEGEPTFPLTNYHVDEVARTVTPQALDRYPLGVIANSQTHCLQLPLAFAFAELAKKGKKGTQKGTGYFSGLRDTGGVATAGKKSSLSPFSGDFVGFAERLLLGLGEVIASAWQLIEATDSASQRAAAKAAQDAVWSIHDLGDLGGLLFGSGERFMTDLAMNLEVRAAINDLRRADHLAGSLRELLDVLVPYQQRLGFADACHGPLYDVLDAALSHLDDDGINAALTRWRNWADPSVRNGALTALLDAIDDFCQRA